MTAPNYQNQEIREVTALSANRREEPIEEADSRGVGAKNAIIPLAELVFLQVAVVIQTINMLALAAALLWVLLR